MDNLHVDAPDLPPEKQADPPPPPGAQDPTRMSLADFTHVIGRLGVGTWIWQADSGLHLVNDRWAEMLGYQKDALQPVTLDAFFQFLHPQAREDLGTVFRGLVPGENEQFDLTIRMRHAQGHWVHVQTRGRATQWDAEGRPAVIMGVHIDVSELRATERRLEDVIRGAQVGTWQSDLRTGINAVDARWAEIVGYSPAELADMTIPDWLEMIHPDDRVSLLHRMDEVDARVDESFDNEMRLRHKAGHWVWVLSRGRVTEWDEDGRPVVSSGVHIDISAQKDLEAELARERDFLSKIMETSVSGVMVVNENADPVFANHEAEMMIGRSISELAVPGFDPALLDMRGADGQPLALEELPISQAATGGQDTRNQRISLLHPDGTRRHLSINSAPLRAEGQADWIVLSAVDVTEAVRAEAELRASAERLAAASRAKSEFLANMSHEIRTPLNGVLGMAELLAKRLSDPTDRRMLDAIRLSGEHLLGVINDILDLAKIESGAFTLEERPFQPDVLGHRIEALHRPAAEAKGVSLRLLTDGDVRRISRIGDATRVLQILHNLVGNAVKFTEAGEVLLTLAVPQEGWLAIEVADTGIGMAEDQIARVFEDFMQADGSITRRYGGTGLGLPIVRRLVDRMGGTVQLDSAPGVGTRVRVGLPLAAYTCPEPAAPALTPAMPVPEPRPLTGLRALAAEDNATNQLVLSAMLQSLGVTHRIVADGDEAVAEWQPCRYDILLFDIAMPKKDGISALAALQDKARDLQAELPPALAVTANAMTHHLAHYLQAGFAGCVPKPLRVEDLAQSIRAAVAAGRRD